MSTVWFVGRLGFSADTLHPVPGAVSKNGKAKLDLCGRADAATKAKVAEKAARKERGAIAESKWAGMEYATHKRGGGGRTVDHPATRTRSYIRYGSAAGYARFLQAC